MARTDTPTSVVTEETKLASVSDPTNDSQYPPQQNEVVHNDSSLLMPAAVLKPPSKTPTCEKMGVIIAEVVCPVWDLV